MDDAELVADTIAHHALESLRLTATPDGALKAYGDERWAMARYHLHVAQTLQLLADGDTARAAVIIRERALGALAAAKETP